MTKYVSPLKQGAVEYKLSSKARNKIFRMYFHPYTYGLVKYKYYEMDKQIIVEKWYTPLTLLYILVMFIPGVLTFGIYDTVDAVKDIWKYVFKEPVVVNDFCKINKISNIETELYTEFMKYAKKK